MMYGTFHRCRHAKPDCGELLELLNNILEAVSQQGRLLVEVSDQHIPDKWIKAVQDDTRRAIAHMEDMKLRDHDALSTQNQSLLALMQTGARELCRLWTTDEKAAVQSLGYAFHVIPQLLRTPEKFSRESYMWCFRIISAYWDKLSIGMQEAFCAVVGLELGAAQTLINTEGFSIKSTIGSSDPRK